MKVNQEEEHQTIARKIPRKIPKSLKIHKQKILTKNQKPNVKKMNTTVKYPPPFVFYKKLCTNNNNASKKQESEAQKDRETRPHDDAAASEG